MDWINNGWDFLALAVGGSFLLFSVTMLISVLVGIARKKR